MPKAILVVPCFNEARRLNVAEFQRHVTEHQQISFLFVDDGSSDDTYRIILELSQRNPDSVSVLKLALNHGKGEAVRQGILEAWKSEPDYVGYWDADLATPLSVISDFCRVLDDRPELDIVLGARVKMLGRQIERRAIRHYVGRVFATGASVVLGTGVYDTQCGAKLFRCSSRVESIFDRPFVTTWIFDVEILARYLHTQSISGERAAIDRICEYPLQRWHHVAGSKLRLHHYLRSAYDLAVIFWRYRLFSYPRLGGVQSTNLVDELNAKDPSSPKTEAGCP